MSAEKKLNEPVLEDDYPVHAGYAYVVDGKPIASEISGNVKRLKAHMKATEVRRCDLAGRDLF